MDAEGACGRLQGGGAGDGRGRHVEANGKHGSRHIETRALQGLQLAVVGLHLPGDHRREAHENHHDAGARQHQRPSAVAVDRKHHKNGAAEVDDVDDELCDLNVHLQLGGLQHAGPVAEQRIDARELLHPLQAVGDQHPPPDGGVPEERGPRRLLVLALHGLLQVQQLRLRGLFAAPQERERGQRLILTLRLLPLTICLDERKAWGLREAEDAQAHDDGRVDRQRE
mmetsp:Transcript_1113/g.2741  ORF Transcript_1113/g.2741 Transcript_1113/m.2741 type:complete len:226 (+) Transcript_1113:561-1238(+)